mmetsp:Transcript_31917/g.80286  ORF Transcript_31917/g.80286 Transcript_31917/m.80286 type:complete len:255 (+) Transcript_31917:742-1506(+)
MVAVSPDAKSTNTRERRHAARASAPLRLLSDFTYFALVLHCAVRDKEDKWDGARGAAFRQHGQGSLKRGHDVGSAACSAMRRHPRDGTLHRLGYGLHQTLVGKIFLQVVERHDVEPVVGGQRSKPSEERLVSGSHGLPEHGPTAVQQKHNRARKGCATLGSGWRQRNRKRASCVVRRAPGRWLLHRGGNDVVAPHRHADLHVAIDPIVRVCGVELNLGDSTALLYQRNWMCAALDGHLAGVGAAHGCDKRQNRG